MGKVFALSLVSGTPCELCASITPVMGRWRQADLRALLASSPANPCAPALVEDHVFKKKKEQLRKIFDIDLWPLDWYTHVHM